eukprot:scaffold27703_cov75-Phaeocystis_antarctica.AAC.3
MLPTTPPGPARVKTESMTAGCQTMHFFCAVSSERPTVSSTTSAKSSAIGATEAALPRLRYRAASALPRRHESCGAAATPRPSSRTAAARTHHRARLGRIVHADAELGTVLRLQRSTPLGALSLGRRDRAQRPC